MPTKQEALKRAAHYEKTLEWVWGFIDGFIQDQEDLEGDDQTDWQGVINLHIEQLERIKDRVGDVLEIEKPKFAESAESDLEAADKEIEALEDEIDDASA